jgi:hypothetical protein
MNKEKNTEDKEDVKEGRWKEIRGVMEASPGVVGEGEQEKGIWGELVWGSVTSNFIFYSRVLEENIERWDSSINHPKACGVLL